MPEAATGNRLPFIISFAGGHDSAPAALRLDLPVLGGDRTEQIFGEAEPAGTSGEFTLYRTAFGLLGCARAALHGDIEGTTAQMYQDLLRAIGGYHLCRIWNYVPAINAIGPEGLEVYRAFSRARSHAFEAEFGADFNRHLPAASAVGTTGNQFAMVFAASIRSPRHVENPRQVPAYEYPPEHGPRSPSFARASVVSWSERKCDVFISGTAAIKGHTTVAAGDALNQLTCTLENLRDVSRGCGLGSDLGLGTCRERHFKIYLRRAGDFPSVRDSLEQHLLQPGDHVSYLHADVCRAALNLEIEATILGAVGPG